LIQGREWPSGHPLLWLIALKAREDEGELGQSLGILSLPQWQSSSDNQHLLCQILIKGNEPAFQVLKFQPKSCQHKI